MNKLRTLILLLVASVVSMAWAGDPVAGQAAAEICTSCHGADGATPLVANYPIIAGQHESYLYHSMLSYKDGTRNNAVMVQQMDAFSEVDIANLAAYFASLPSPLN